MVLIVIILNLFQIAKKVNDRQLVITNNAKSINYFFDDYQQKGDIYHIPNMNKQFTCNCKYCKGSIMNNLYLHNVVFDHIKQDIKTIDNYKKVIVRNYSKISKLKQFIKLEFNSIYN